MRTEVKANENNFMYQRRLQYADPVMKMPYIYT
jgi:hypothetical protein